MPSKLTFQTPLESKKTYSSSTTFASRPSKKPRMSISQTYYVASTARVKLGKEAMKADHNLRRLVGHANLLDSLMVELRDAERQQEAWFNRSVQSASRSEDRHSVHDEDSDLDSDSDMDESDYQSTLSLSRIRSPTVTITSSSVDSDSDDEVFEDIDSLPELALTRTSSHPPELIHDSDSDDESPPNSPPQSIIEFSSKKPLPTLLIGSGNKSQKTTIISMNHQSSPVISTY